MTIDLNDTQVRVKALDRLVRLHAAYLKSVAKARTAHAKAYYADCAIAIEAGVIALGGKVDAGKAP